MQGNLHVRFGGRYFAVTTKNGDWCGVSTQPYEYSDYNTVQNESIEFDSYMIPEDDLEEGQLRLLSVDNPIFLPTNTHIRLLITSEDVLHS